MAKYLLLKHYRGAPEAANGIPMDQWKPDEVDAHIGHLMEAIVATGSLSGELLGEPSAELRAKLADSGVRLFTSYQSM